MTRVPKLVPFQFSKTTTTSPICHSLHQNGIALVAKNYQENYRKKRRRNDPWRLSTKHIPPRIEAPWKLDLLGGWPPRIIQTAKRINLMTKFTLRQENIATAKDIIFHDGYRPPTKLLRHSLVVLSHQVNFFSW